MIDKIRWIASYPKSGNTWVRCFLQAYLTGKLDINDLNLTMGDSSPFDYQGCSVAPLGALSSYEAAWYRPAALFNMCVRHKGLILKTHNANVKVNGISLIPEFMTHSAVYVVRDPRAVCLSHSKHMGIDVEKSIYSMNNAQCMLAFQNTPVGHWPSS